MSNLDYFINQKKAMKTSSAYLKKGVYILHRNLHTYLYVGTRQNIIEFPHGGEGIRHLIKLLTGRLLFTVYIPQNGKTFQADAVYFATVPNPQYKDMKFFDFSPENNRVLTCCANEKRYHLYIKNRKKFQGKFPMPRLLINDSVNFIYAEELIHGARWRGNEEVEKSVYRELFEFYKAYYCNEETDSVSPNSADNEKLPAILQIDEAFAVCLHHGDLSADNFKTTEDNKLFFFDFDHGNDFPLFYDIFFLIFNEAVNCSNPIGYTLLKNGELDAYFANSKEKEKYLKAFMHRFWLVRLEGVATEEHKNKYLALYKTLLTEMQK